MSQFPILQNGMTITCLWPDCYIVALNGRCLLTLMSLCSPLPPWLWTGPWGLLWTMEHWQTWCKQRLSSACTLGISPSEHSLLQSHFHAGWTTEWWGATHGEGPRRVSHHLRPPSLRQALSRMHPHEQAPCGTEEPPSQPQSTHGIMRNNKLLLQVTKLWSSLLHKNK